MFKKWFEYMKYRETKKDPKSMSNWYPIFKNTITVSMPDTLVIDLDFKKYSWMHSLKYTEEDVIGFDRWLKNEILSSGFNVDRELFIKTGTCSGISVFGDFNTCYIRNFYEENIGKKILDVFYWAFCSGHEGGSEIVIRELLSTECARGSVLNGLKLNSVYRVFYDFSHRFPTRIYSYWQTRKIRQLIIDEQDLRAMKEYKQVLDADLKKHSSLLTRMPFKLINRRGGKFSGIWSFDFMFVNGEPFLIDIQLGSFDYFGERYSENDLSFCEAIDLSSVLD